MKQLQNNYLFFTLFFFSFCVCGSEIDVSNPSLSTEEALHTRRLITIYQSKDWFFFTEQFELFKKKFPSNPFLGRLSGLLAEAYLNMGNGIESLKILQQVPLSNMPKNTQRLYFRLLFEMEKYSELVEATLSIPTLSAQFFSKEASLKLIQKQPLTEITRNSALLLINDYKKFLRSEYAQKSYEGIAQLELYTQQPENASKIYQKLYIKTLDSNYLLLKGRAEKLYNPNRAIKIFSHLEQQKETIRAQAILEHMQLLFQIGKYEVLLKKGTQWIQALRGKKLEFLLLYEMKSLLALNKNEEILKRAPNALKRRFSNQHIQKFFILSALRAAYQLKKLPEAQHYFSLLNDYFPSQEETQEGLYLMGLLYHFHTQWQQAEGIFSQLIQIPPLSPTIQPKELHHHYALSLYHQQKWAQAFNVFQKLLRLGTTEQQAIEIKELMVQCGLYAYQQTSETQHFLSSATELLEELIATQFTTEDFDEYLLTYAQALYKAKQYVPALKAIQEFLFKFSTHSQIADAHILAALCYREGFQDREGFIHHLEEARKKNETVAIEHSELFLHLFDAYQKTEQLDKGADTLYLLYQNKNNSLPKSLFKWLVDYSIFQIIEKKNYSLQHAQRTHELFLAFHTTPPLNETWGKILELNQLYKEQIHCLTQLPSLSEEGKYSLVTGYLALEKYEKAFDLLEELQHATSTEVKLNAQYQWALLAYQRVPEEQRSLKSTQIQNILQILRELQDQKYFNLEPLHLNAALKYISITLALSPQEHSTEEALSLMLQAKEHFSNQTDIWSKQYHTLREMNPEKAKIWHTYMTLFEGNIALYQFKTVTSNSRKRIALESASILFNELNKNASSDISPYIEKGIAELESIKRDLSLKLE